MTKKQRPVGVKSLKNKVLGMDYELSVVFCKDTLAKKLNRIYRKKNKPANVLAFPLSKNSGEIFVNVETAAREAADYGRTKNEHIFYLFIHALLHLKGLSHGRKMDKMERIYGAKYYHWH